jgi:pyruvate formate lyase activating enzyme
MKIGGLQKTSLIDFPDCVSAVVFLQGCNFRCPFCHNPELVLAARFQKPVEEADFFAFLGRRRGQLDGVVISGGEPTVHADLPDFIRRIRALGFKVKLDTNGSNPAMLRALYAEKLLDFVAMDVKGDPDRYPDYCGAKISGAGLRESIALIRNASVSYEFRTTAVPGQHDLAALKAIAETIRGARHYAIQAFRPDLCLNPEFEKLPRYDLSEVRREKAWFESVVQVFELRGDASKNELPDRRGMPGGN